MPNTLAIAIQAVLIKLWTAAWAAGSEAAGGEDNQQEMHNLLHQLAAIWIAQIVSTTLKLLAKAIGTGGDPKAVLQDAQRAHDIAQTEITRVMAEAAQKAYRDRGVVHVRWVTEPPDPCPECLANEAAGPWPLGVPFPSGAMSPPQHPRCRCAIVPA